MSNITIKKIGILGGAGPSSTARFFNDVIMISQNKYGAEQDTEFPEIILYNMPMHGFNETGFEDSELVKKQLIEGVQKLELWGVDFIVIPCNTIHHFIIEMRDSVKIPIISIIESTTNEIVKTSAKKIGILSSRSTRDLNLYKNAFENEKLETLIANDDEQADLDNIVLKVMSGNQSENEKNIILNINARMTNDGAECIVLGCTEIPMAIKQDDTDIKLHNTIRILAEYAVDEAYKI